MFSALKKIGLMALALAVVAAPAAAQTKAPKSAFAPISAEAQAKSLGRGVNVLGFDPLWKDFDKRQFDARHFAKIRAAGFDTVRVVLFAFPHMDAQNRIDPAWLKSLDWVVDTGLASGLNVIIENQDMAWCGQNAEACRPKLLAFWEQVAPRYKDKSNKLVFELLNEPNNQLDAVWNARAAELLGVIRRTNPRRNVIVDAVGWAHFKRLPELELPAKDRHLIATIHYYDPRPFTHQGAGWAEPEVKNLSNLAWGSEADRKQLRDDFAFMKRWSQANRRPLYIGEFGAYDKGPLESRVRYARAVAREAEANGFSWAWWQFDHDFVVYDMAKDEWFEPILKALIPETTP
jgi:endoglucanase